jgi:hypothetical protein
MLLHRTHGIHVPAHEFSLQVRLFRLISADQTIVAVVTWSYGTPLARTVYKATGEISEKNDLVFVCAHDACSDISAAACCMQRDANLLQRKRDAAHISRDIMN